MQAILTNDAYSQIAELAQNRFKDRSVNCCILMNIAETYNEDFFVVDKLKDESDKVCYLLIAMGGMPKLEDGLNIILDLALDSLLGKLKHGGCIEDVEVIKMTEVKDLDSAKDLLHLTQEFYPCAKNYSTINSVSTSQQDEINKRFVHSINAVQSKNVLIAGNSPLSYWIAERLAFSGVGHMSVISNSLVGYYEYTYIPTFTKYHMKRKFCDAVAEQLVKNNPFECEIISIYDKIKQIAHDSYFELFDLVIVVDGLSETVKSCFNAKTNVITFEKTKNGARICGFTPHSGTKVDCYCKSKHNKFTSFTDTALISGLISDYALQMLLNRVDDYSEGIEFEINLNEYTVTRYSTNDMD